MKRARGIEKNQIKSIKRWRRSEQQRKKCWRIFSSEFKSYVEWPYNFVLLFYFDVKAIAGKTSVRKIKCQLMYSVERSTLTNEMTASPSFIDRKRMLIPLFNLQLFYHGSCMWMRYMFSFLNIMCSFSRLLRSKLSNDFIGILWFALVLFCCRAIPFVYRSYNLELSMYCK